MKRIGVHGGFLFLVAVCIGLSFGLHAAQVHAAAGDKVQGAIGADCTTDINPRYVGSPIFDGFDTKHAACKTQTTCQQEAPGDKKTYIWDPQSPDCSNAQSDPGGCCFYPPVSTPTTAPYDPGSSTDLCDPLNAGSILVVLNRVILTFLGIVGALALLVFIYAGFLYMTSGDSDRLDTAKRAMKYAVIGLAIITFAYALTTFFLSALIGTDLGTSSGTAAASGQHCNGQ